MKINFYLGFVVVFLLSCRSYVISNQQSENNSVERTESANSELLEIITPYSDSLEKTMSGVIGYSEVELFTGSPEGKLGNFVADLCLSIGNKKYTNDVGDTADFVLLNNGGFRTFMPAGAITTGKIYEIMPFENELVVVTLSIEKTVELIQYIAEKTAKEGSRKQGVPVSGNVRVELMDKTPVEVLVNGARLRGRPYKVITTDYLANGGDNMSFFLNPLQYQKLNIKLRDAILQEVIELDKSGLKVSAKLDNRVKYVD